MNADKVQENRNVLCRLLLCLVAEGIGMQFLCFVYLEAKLVARVADGLKLLYRAQTDYTNGLDECVGRLQPRLLN